MLCALFSCLYTGWQFSLPPPCSPPPLLQLISQLQPLLLLSLHCNQLVGWQAILPPPAPKPRLVVLFFSTQNHNHPWFGLCPLLVHTTLHFHPKVRLWQMYWVYLCITNNVLTAHRMAPQLEPFPTWKTHRLQIFFPELKAVVTSFEKDLPEFNFVRATLPLQLLVHLRMIFA